jgi:putative ATP-dependent endonuclease of OLD family
MPAKKAANKAATKTAVHQEISETRETRARLLKLIVKNFRCIGCNPVEVELDDIVILVGANNAGKSSILKAYEVIMSSGRLGELTIDDFPGGSVDSQNLPEIELHTVVTVNRPGDEWVDADGLVKERWVWLQPGKGERFGYLHNENRWATAADPERGPWGAVAQSRRPQVHRIGAFSPPEESAKEIIALLEQIVKDRLVAEQNSTNEEQQTDYQKLLGAVGELQRKVANETRESIAEIEGEFSRQIAKVFPGYIVKFDAQPETALEKALSFFKGGSQLLIGPADGYKSGIERQGGGACRTLLWTALRLLRDRKSTRPGAPQVLLLDEPEICLHPNAVRSASDLLYALPCETGNWQVMVTTHSPCFIDFEKPHTKIARVFRDENGQVYGTTIFRPETDLFTEEEKEALKLSNLCDPFLAEFFFGGRTILVEGDTEHAAFNYVISVYPEEFKNLHIVRARGKAAISGLAKILNQFGKPYAVLHDSDRPTCKRRDGTTITNGAWTYNLTIRRIISAAPAGVSVRLFASVPNFEEAYLDYVSRGEKPFSAVTRLRTDQAALERVKDLLLALSDATLPAPQGAVEWSEIEQLIAALPQDR